MLCDRQFTHYSGMTFQGKTKCMELGEEKAMPLFGASKAVIGGAGSTTELGHTWNWLYLMDKKPPRIRNSEFLLVTSNNEIMHSDDLMHWTHIDEPYFSIGSGSAYAMGALASGSTLELAMEAAIKYDRGTGLGYVRYDL
jgi:hypothetical protein